MSTLVVYYINCNDFKGSLLNKLHKQQNTHKPFYQLRMGLIHSTVYNAYCDATTSEAFFPSLHNMHCRLWIFLQRLKYGCKFWIVCEVFEFLPETKYQFNPMLHGVLKTPWTLGEEDFTTLLTHLFFILETQDLVHWICLVLSLNFAYKIWQILVSDVTMMSY